MAGTYYSYNDLKGYPYSSLVADYPFHDYWRSNPLSPWGWVDPREAGFRPIQKNVTINYQPAWEEPTAVYQSECDWIRPANLFYMNQPQEYLADLIFNR